MAHLTGKKLSEIAADLNQPLPENVKQRLSHMIDYAVGRHDWYEEQRGKLFQAALGMISFVAAAAAIVSSFGELHSGFVLFFCLGLIFLGGTACRLIYLYTKVSEKNHPYRAVADIRSWYYRYTFEGQLADDLDTIASHEEKAKAVQEVRENYQKFILKVIDGQDEFEDLQQVFILYLLQNYRQKNLKKMYSVTKIGIIISSLLLGISLVFLMYQPLCEVYGGLRDIFAIRT